jgi:hypothetical protein
MIPYYTATHNASINNLGKNPRQETEEPDAKTNDIVGTV